MRQQLHQKLQKLSSLRTEVDNLLKGMQEKIDTVSASLQAYQGQPKLLALSLQQEFNIRSQTVQTLDTEINKTVQQVNELRSKMTAATGKGKTGLEVLKTGYTVPIKPCTITDSELPLVQPLVLGFPVTPNQFNILSKDEVACSELGQDQNLEDPRQTRAQRHSASSRIEKQGIVLSEGVAEDLVPLNSENEPTFFHSLSVSAPDILGLQSSGLVQNLLESGAAVDDALYENDVYDVACTDGTCNKRISVAGPERLAGRPGHTPTRCDLACGKHVEDSCAGQDWSAGQPGNRPFGASFTACLPSHTACLGPYGIAARQPHHTGHNTREEKSIASSSTRRPRDQSTSQPTASSSGRPAAKDRASPATVALHPRRPPYFCGGQDEDVHVWTSIVSRWLETIQGEPSRQLTFVVSLLRGAAYEWYLHYETHTGCPGDLTTLRLAMLERFGSSIRAKKARARLRQLNQDKMTVLQYADAFESYLAQLGEYDESYYLTHFIFGLRPKVMRGVYIQ